MYIYQGKFQVRITIFIAFLENWTFESWPYILLKRPAYVTMSGKDGCICWNKMSIWLHWGSLSVHFWRRKVLISALLDTTHDLKTYTSCTAELLGVFFSFQQKSVLGLYFRSRKRTLHFVKTILKDIEGHGVVHTSIYDRRQDPFLTPAMITVDTKEVKHLQCLTDRKSVV